GVDQVVGHVHDAPVGQVLLQARVGELVVGAAADDAGLQGGRGGVADRAAERAGGVDVHRGGGQLLRAGGDLDGGVLVADPLDGRGAAVADQDLGAGLGQVADQAAADLADALDGDAAAGQVLGAPDVLGGGQHALVDAVGGEDRGVAGAAVGGRAA